MNFKKNPNNIECFIFQCILGKSVPNFVVNYQRFVKDCISVHIQQQ